MTGLHAITVPQPRAWQLAVGALELVNHRGLGLLPGFVGGHLAIYAPRWVDEPAYRRLARGPRAALWKREPLPQPQELELSAVVAIATLAGAIRTEGKADGLSLRKKFAWGSLSDQRIAKVLGQREAFGPWVLVFDDVVRLPYPVPVSGPASGFWLLPDVITEQVRDALNVARRSTTP